MSRSIFEEVEDTGKKNSAPSKVGHKRDARRAISIWLVVLFVMVVAMIVVGGLTRLTDSGLSITEWAPISGAIPPLSDAAWAEEFAKYQQSPEFQLQNSAMQLSDFKYIFWWEWAHRFLGRVVGLVWAAGFFWFLGRKLIPTGWTTRLFTLGVLGGLQGVIGWWMVSSGLTGRMVDVASYRLAIHLGLAFFILGLIAWYVMLLSRAEVDLLQARRQREASLGRLGTALVVVVFAQILLGALVAGIDAGRSFPSWPSMNGELLPSESFDYTPLWSNFFENPALVQFNHRLLAYAAFLTGLFVWWKSRSSAVARTRSAFDWMMAIMFGQVVLGIVTALYAAPLSVAILHQICAVVLFVLVLRARFAALYPRRQSLR